MAIKISGTTVVNDSRQLQNIASVDATTAAVIAAQGGITISSSAPTAVNGKLWIDSGSNVLQVYNDGEWNDIKFVGSGNEEDGGHLYVQDPSREDQYDDRGFSLNNPYNETYIFTVPNGVQNISVVCIGRGFNNPLTYCGQNGGGGNPGGGLAYKNNISVTSGDQFTITLDSNFARFFKSGVCDVRGDVGAGKAGGGYSGGDGGGNGGAGGDTTYSGSLYVGSGSGGAGGYAGAGGKGGSGSGLSAAAGQNGSGGGGGGGGNGWDSQAGSGYMGGAGGGGTSPYGQGSNGVGGSGDTNSGATSNAGAGTEGSGNVSGLPTSSQVRERIFFGAGHGGGYAHSPPNFASRNTMTGCVRVVWGQGNSQAFPTTNVGYRTNEVLN